MSWVVQFAARTSVLYLLLASAFVAIAAAPAQQGSAAIAGSVILAAAFANARSSTPVEAVFAKLKALQGSWEGNDEHGMVVKSTFKVMVSGTVVMETLKMPENEEMITFYTADGDGIALVHYCPTNNQPRMRAVPSGNGDGKELAFTFQGAGNLPNPETGHEHQLVMQFRDDGHITERWTWRRNGKDSEMVYQLARKN
jgi:hypothetical protein